MTTWLRPRRLDVLLSSLLALVEAAAAAPWLRLAAGESNLPAAGLFVLGLALFWVTRSLIAAGWDPAAVRVVDIAVWLVLMVGWYSATVESWRVMPFGLADDLLGGQRAAVVAVLAGVVVWWRAGRLGPDPDALTVETTRRIAVRAMVVVGVAAVVAALGRGGTSARMQDTAATAVPLVFVGGLVAAATAQFRDTIGRRSRQNSTGASRWLGSASIVAVVLFVIAALLAALASRDAGALVGGPFEAVAGWLGTIAFWAVVAVAYAFFLLAMPVIWLIRLVAGGGQSDTGQRSSPLPPPPAQFVNDAQTSVPVALRLALEVSVAALLVIGGLWLVLRGVRRYQHLHEPGEVDEVRESIWSWELARDQMLGWRPRVRHRRYPRASRLDLDLPPANVRTAYRYLLDLGGRSGIRREPSQTPNDYAKVIASHWHGLSGPIDDLTWRYLRVRYGEMDDPDDRRGARDEWRIIYYRAGVSTTSTGDEPSAS